VPVLAHRIGTLQEIVEENQTGMLFANADELAAKASQMAQDKVLLVRLSANARLAYESKFTAAKHYEGLMGIYQKVLHGQSHQKI
jgi:glycosyltransferase involved in cell wall biosynthesis